MPYLQLDVPLSYPAAAKCALAAELGAIYSAVMGTTAEKVVVSVRELGEGNMWRCQDPPVPAAALKCDIRRGRSREVHARLAQCLVEACARRLKFAPEFLTVEFTQHPGEDFYRPGIGLVSDWSPAEAS